MRIRPETPADHEAITAVTLAAFTGLFSNNPTEHLMILRLRAADALSLSLVADSEGRVVGHAAFSAVTINGQQLGWYGLGPISVQPALQRQGVGSQLIRAGLAELQARGARGCVVEGSPLYYERFGFRAYPQLIYEAAPAPQYFMALPFQADVPDGRVEYHTAFYGELPAP